LQRLRDSGYSALASAAGQAWSQGRSIRLLRGEIVEPELLDAFEQANREAAEGAE
jgi:hypothetical protein